jgi:hypothetical protein
LAVKIGIQDFKRVKSAGDERAEKIEGKDERLVGEPGVEGARGQQQAEVRGDAGVREQSDICAPAELRLQQLDGGAGCREGQVLGVPGPAIRVKVADAEIAARDKHGAARRAPISAGNLSGELRDRRQPGRHGGFVELAAGAKGERHGVAAVGSQDWNRAQGALAAEQGRESRLRVAQRSDAAGGAEADGSGFRGNAHDLFNRE